jgi:hypothetical protein
MRDNLARERRRSGYSMSFEGARKDCFWSAPALNRAQSQRTGQTKLTSHWTMYDKYRDSMAARFEEPISLQATLCQEKAMLRQ